MEEEENYEEIEREVKKIRYNLKREDISLSERLIILNMLRYDLGLLEDRDKVKKVVYNEETKKLEYSESVEIGIAIVIGINEEIRVQKDKGMQVKLYEAMKQTYYYLARYLFEYFLPAMEFGIPPEKQFIAPRTCVLNRVAREMTKFYYREDRPIMTLSMPQGTGKEQPLSSKILTPTGWITMGDVKVGTKVIGADGKACNVTGVYPKGVKDVYRVEFNDGTYVDCGLEHLWEVQTLEDRRNNKKPRILQTKDMIGKEIKGIKSPYRDYSVRLVKPIEFESKLTKNDLDPYYLGTLIGDGSLSREHFNITIAENEMLEKISNTMPKTDMLRKLKGDNYDYAIKNVKTRINEDGKKKPSYTKEKIVEYGLNGVSNTKFIPQKYLFASIEERIKLLNGLMDTDGYVGDGENCCEYTTVSEQLCKDMIELVQGLGGKAKYTTKIGKYRKSNGEVQICQKVYRVWITLNFNPFSLTRKASNWKKSEKYYKKYISSITKVRQEECQCIMVDHPEHLYVTDGYTLTHNTEISKRFMSWAIGKDSHLPNMMISYSAAIAKDKFYNGIDALIKDDYGNYGKIFPKIRELYRSGETLSLDYTDEPNRKKPHSEYTLYCVGFDGSVTGRTRAHNILYADDLVKDIEEASNKDIMDKKWIEFTGTIKKRMQGKCKMLLVGTMFSINDPLTRTINYYREHEPERLIEIRIPGLNENDESNFNYKYGYAITTKMFHEDRDLMDPVSFSCLIQQNPIERAGLLFFEEEFKKFDLSTYERNEEEYQRTVAACDVAWGGDDHLSMPIVDEYSNGDCPVIKWIFLQGDKDETIPEVVNAIITYGVTYVCFEANNGGDMYADAVNRELKKKGYTECFVTSKKAPTNKSKLDRILAAQGFIKGADASDYRMIIPTRESIKSDKQFNEALNEVFAFNQSTAKNVRAKQHDDAPDSASMLASNVLGVQTRIGRASSNISREMLGI